MPAGMMPEPPGCGLYLSARGRRTRSAVREYPRPTALFKGARFGDGINRNGDRSQWKSDNHLAEIAIGSLA
jgi:hypothetical protein